MEISIPRYLGHEYGAAHWKQNSSTYISTAYRVFQANISYFKSAAMLFYKLSANRYGLGLSNELLFIIIDQGTAKLLPVKVGGPRKLPYSGSSTL